MSSNESTIDSDGSSPRPFEMSSSSPAPITFFSKSSSTPQMPTLPRSTPVYSHAIATPFSLTSSQDLYHTTPPLSAFPAFPPSSAFAASSLPSSSIPIPSSSSAKENYPPPHHSSFNLPPGAGLAFPVHPSSIITTTASNGTTIMARARPTYGNRGLNALLKKEAVKIASLVETSQDVKRSNEAQLKRVNISSGSSRTGVAANSKRMRQERERQREREREGKRKVGSYVAPLARTPSLSHAFDFPPSPPTVPQSTHQNGVKIESSARGRSVLNMTSQRLDTGTTGLMSQKGEEGLMTNENGRASMWVDQPPPTSSSSSARASSSSLPPPTSTPITAMMMSHEMSEKERERNVWTRMASDFSPPPSSPPPHHLDLSSPPAASADVLRTSSHLSTTTIAKGNRRSTLAPLSSSAPPSSCLLSSTLDRQAFTPTFSSSLPTSLSGSSIRRSLARSSSLGGCIGVKGGSDRAGGEEACAERALERKRARMNNGIAAAAVLTDVSNTVVVRAEGDGGKKRKSEEGGKKSMLGKKKKKISSLASAATAAASAGTTITRELWGNRSLAPLKTTTTTTLMFDSRSSLDSPQSTSSYSSSSSSSCGELSFSSTTTTSSSTTSHRTPTSATMSEPSIMTTKSTLGGMKNYVGSYFPLHPGPSSSSAILVGSGGGGGGGGTMTSERGLHRVSSTRSLESDVRGAKPSSVEEMERECAQLLLGLGGGGLR